LKQQGRGRGGKMESVSLEYLVAILLFVIAILLFEGIILYSVFILTNKLSSLGDEQAKADSGLVFCRLGKNYVWLTPSEYQRLCLTDNGEG
jgi:hypothetical protein